MRVLIIAQQLLVKDDVAAIMANDRRTPARSGG
jgi:hypothetical protein